MEVLAKKLKEKAAQLGISNAAVARRMELDERRYAHYVSGRRSPDLAMLVKIADTLGTTPNELLGIEEHHSENPEVNDLLNRLLRAARIMSQEELELCVVQAEAIARHDRR